MGRPRPFSKELALASLLRALEASSRDVDIIFLNDGPIPRDRLAMMEAVGEPVSCSEGGQVKSHLRALELVQERAWPDEDLVYFVEDDYLHSPEAVDCLIEAAEAVPAAAYFGLYGSIDWSGTEYFFRVGATDWYGADSTTSTFAARVGAVRGDMAIHRLAYRADGPWDRDTCHAYQGKRPYRWKRIVSGLLGADPADFLVGRRTAVKRAVWRVILNGLAIRRVLSPHVLIAPVPALATHMMLNHLAPGVDWDALAESVDDWAASWHP